MRDYVNVMFDNQHLPIVKSAVMGLTQSLHRLDTMGWPNLLSGPLLGIMDGGCDLRCESWKYGIQADLSVIVYLTKVEERGPNADGDIVWKNHGNLAFRIYGNIVELEGF